MKELTKRLSDNAYTLMMEFEVGGGRSYYERFLKSPVWPGGESGCTVGIGYDLGYNKDQTIQDDWQQGGLPPYEVSRLTACALIKGRQCQSIVKHMKDVVIPWETSWWVFNERTLPKFIKLTVVTFPGAAEKLSADGFGALVSLVYNRGGSLSGSRRVQMRNIAALVKQLPAGDVLTRSIANQVRLMIPVWNGTDIYTAMKRRRNEEADLIEGK